VEPELAVCHRHGGLDLEYHAQRSRAQFYKPHNTVIAGAICDGEDKDDVDLIFQHNNQPVVRCIPGREAGGDLDDNDEGNNNHKDDNNNDGEQGQQRRPQRQGQQQGQQQPHF
jgi:hypothetical protein